METSDPSSSRRYALRPLLVLVVLFVATLARAGFVLDSISGGSGTYFNGYPLNYTPYSTGGYGINYPMASCSGTITAVLKWQPDQSSADEPVPKVAVVWQGCIATRGDGGTCDNGLNAPVVGYTCGEQTSNPGSPIYHPSIHPVGADGKVTVTLSPSATSTGGGPGATVMYYVSATPMRIIFSGVHTTNDYGEPQGGNVECLVGQKIQAQVDGGGLLLTSISWSGFGGCFQSASFGPDQYGNPLEPGGPPQAGKVSHDYNPLNPADLLNHDIVEFFVGQPAAPLTISCDLVVQSSDGRVNQAVTLTRDVQVLNPGYRMLLITGHSDLTGGAASPDGIYAGDPQNDPGIITAYHVDNMPDFENGSDKGEYAMVQLVKFDEWQYRAGFSGKQDEHHAPQNTTDPYALDSSWPYGDVWYTPGLGTQQDSDSPGSTLYTYFIGYSTFFHAADDFADFLAYRPPLGISLDTAHVPLEERDWSWHCEDGRNGNGLWIDPPGMNPYPGSVIEFPLDQFRWHECFQL